MKNEIEFLVELIKNENLPRESKDMILSRIIEVSKVNQTITLGSPTITYIPSVFGTTDTCLHEYPFPWNSVLPPHCKKCGKQATNYTITCGNSAQYTNGYAQFTGDSNN